MIGIATKQENIRDIINALRQEIKTEGSNVTINILSISEPPKPRYITDPRRLLEFKPESIQQIIARTSKDPFLSTRDAEKELGVSYNTIIKYLKFGLIEGEHDITLGWHIRQSEVNRLKENPNWLKEFRELARNKPLPDKSEMFHKKRVEVMDEIEGLWRDHFPLNPRYANKHYGGLYQKARRYFGSWAIAIKICGIDFSQVYKSMGVKGRPKQTEEQRYLKKYLLFMELNKLAEMGLLNAEAKNRLRSKVREYIGGWKKIKYLTAKKPKGGEEK